MLIWKVISKILKNELRADSGEQLWVWYIQDIWAETEAFRWNFYIKMKRGKAESLKL